MNSGGAAGGAAGSAENTPPPSLGIRSASAPLQEPSSVTHLFSSPACYLRLRVLCLSAPASLCLSVHAALLPAVKEVLQLLNTNVVSAFRQAAEGDAANHLLRMFEQIEACKPQQQRAFAAKLLRMMANDAKRTAAAAGTAAAAADGSHASAAALASDDPNMSSALSGGSPSPAAAAPFGFDDFVQLMHE